MSALEGKASTLPPTAELVDMLADGATYDDLAALHGVTVKHLRGIVHQSGLHDTGRDDDTADVIDLFAAFTAQDVTWMEAGLCAQTDPESFFPEKGGSTREAKRVCRTCTVAAECLDWALDNDERFGIWGGLSERERRALKRALNAQPTCQE